MSTLVICLVLVGLVAAAALRARARRRVDRKPATPRGRLERANELRWWARLGAVVKLAVVVVLVGASAAIAIGLALVGLMTGLRTAIG